MKAKIIMIMFLLSFLLFFTYEFSFKEELCERFYEKKEIIVHQVGSHFEKEIEERLRKY